MPDLPGGTVTFLFTDIEGSTRLWEQHPEAMRLALDRHDEIVRSAITQNGGQVFKTMGDSFCAAFFTPLTAPRAALAAQLALVREPWRDEVTIKVRMGLHTGAAEARRFLPFRVGKPSTLVLLQEEAPASLFRSIHPASS